MRIFVKPSLNNETSLYVYSLSRVSIMRQAYANIRAEAIDYRR